MTVPLYAQDFVLGKEYIFLKSKEQLTVTGRLAGVNLRSLSGNLALTDVRIDGYGWISLQEWMIKGEAK